MERFELPSGAEREPPGFIRSAARARHSSRLSSLDDFLAALVRADVLRRIEARTLPRAYWYLWRRCERTQERAASHRLLAVIYMGLSLLDERQSVLYRRFFQREAT